MEDIFKGFIESEAYMILGVIYLLVFLGGAVLVALRVASRYDRECRKSEEAYKIYRDKVRK